MLLRRRAKGRGRITLPQRQVPGQRGGRQGSSTYIATLLYGSLAVLDVKGMEQELPKWTAEVLESNRMKAAEEKIQFADGRVGPHQACDLHHQGEPDLRSDVLAI